MADKKSSGSAKKKQKSGHGPKANTPQEATKSNSATCSSAAVEQVVAPESSGDSKTPVLTNEHKPTTTSETYSTESNDKSEKPKQSNTSSVKAVDELHVNLQGLDIGDSTSSACAETKSKAQLRAERRAIQEAQRAQKAANKLTGVAGNANKENKETGVKAVQSSEATHAKSDSGAVVAGNVKKVAVIKGQSNSNSAVSVANKKSDQSAAAVPGSKDVKIRVPDRMQVDDEKVVRRQTKKLDRQNIPQRSSAGQKRVSLFRHLVQYERNTEWTHICHQLDKPVLHRAIWKLGLQYMEGTICGSNARCIALLMAMKEVIADYKTPPNSDLSRDLEVYIRPFIGFLNQCRPLSVSMGNAIKYLKHHITNIKSDETDTKAKHSLIEAINEFVRLRIQLADDAISDDTCKSIHNGDVILVYSCSSLVRKVLRDAHKKGIKFTVIVADGRPMLEGRVMLQRLVADGIKCYYVLINSVSYVMHEVTKVLLGAHALLANGFVMSRVGSSQIALIAKTYNVPVLVCCETYKFCERVQTDSFVFNELGDPDDLVAAKNGLLRGWRNVAPLHVLNLVYDVTPAELLSSVVTELGSIPSTAVPVVLRVKYSES